MATKKRPGTQRKVTHGLSTNNTLSIVLSFFIGYAVAHVFDINFVGNQLDGIIQKQHSQAPTPPQEQAKQTLPKPKFEYYSLLKKDRGKANHPNKLKPAIEIREANPLKPTNQQNRQYLLQLASYYKKEDADRVKAELILQGHQAYITERQVDNRTVYRLMLGPFKRKTEAEREQVDLARQLNVMGVIKKTLIS